MFAVRKLAAVAASTILFGTTALAQVISVAPEITQGTVETVTFTDAAQANKTIVISITGGYPVELIKVEVKTDASGVGTAKFTVPAWVAAAFNGGNAPEVVSLIH